MSSEFFFRVFEEMNHSLFSWRYKTQNLSFVFSLSLLSLCFKMHNRYNAFLPNFTFTTPAVAQNGINYRSAVRNFAAFLSTTINLFSDL